MTPERTETVPVPVPVDLDDVLTPGWLTAALAPHLDGARVTHVEPGPVVARVCTNARFRIETDEPVPGGFPADLCVKGFFGDLLREYRHAGEPEARFYGDVAPALGMRTLPCFYAGVDPITRHGVVVTQDVVAGGAQFLEPSSGYTPDQAAASLDELATLHVATWGADAYADVPWLASRLRRQLEARGVDEVRGNFEGPIGSLVPTEVRDAEALVGAYRRLADQMPTAAPWTVVHGDPHICNVYLDHAGRPSFVDWQLVQRGPWYLDVGYHIAAVLTVEDRRRAERDLVRHYVDRVAAAGIPMPPIDELWPDLRRGIILGFYLWAITLMVDPSITTRMLERLGTAASDHGALGAK